MGIYWLCGFFSPPRLLLLTTSQQACRMAVELGLNKYVPEPPPGETDQQFRERRNRERTYLVLFVHDRSLSMQTGRNWMLPPCDLVSRAETWHDNTRDSVRPEDVIVSAFVVLRRFASDTTDWFFVNKTAPSDVQFDMMVRSVNEKLVRWMEHWSNELRRGTCVRL
jgi:hypothetical protein